MYKVIQDCTAQNKNYEDPDFPHVVQKITDNINHKYYQQYFADAEWLRPDQLFKVPYAQIKLFEKIEPNDIKQGMLGVCYMLSALSAIAEYPERIQRIFVNQVSNSQGAYSVVFYKNGVPTEVMTDDYIPCIKNRNEPLFSKPNGVELWVLLLEKLWSKQFGSYTNAEKMWPSYALEEILGCPTYSYNTKDVKAADLFPILQNADQKKEIVIASSKTEKIAEGLVPGHAYSIISVYDVNGIKLLKMRNPWGHGEIAGTEYRDSSPKWTAEMKAAVQYQEGEDGVFFLTINEFMMFFTALSFGAYVDNFKYSYVTEPAPEKNVPYYYTVDIPKDGDYSFRVHEPFDRYDSNPNYKYSPCQFHLFRLKDGTQAEFVAAGDNDCFFGKKTMGLEDKKAYHTLQAGKYALQIKMTWETDKVYPITLSCYAADQVNFTRIERAAGDQYKLSAIQDIALKQTASKAKSYNVYTFAAEYYNAYYVLYFKNISTNKLQFTINTPKLQNMQLQGPNAKSAKQLQFTLDKDQTLTDYIEIVDKRKQCSISWSFQIQQVD